MSASGTTWKAYRAQVNFGYTLGHSHLRTASVHELSPQHLYL
jgi:hypothetical protein